MHPINFSSLSFNKIPSVKTLNFTSNPFKKSISEIQGDTFVRTQKDENDKTDKLDQQSEIDSIKARIETDKERILQAESAFHKANEEYILAKEKRDNTKEEAVRVLQEGGLKPSSVLSEYPEKFENMLIEIQGNKDLSNALHETADDCSEKFKAMLKAKNSYEAAIEHLQQLEQYLAEMNEDPVTAFLFDPDLSKAEKDKILSTAKTIKTFDDIGEDLGILPKEVQAWFKAGHFDAVRPPSYTRIIRIFINTDKEKNKKFLEQIKPQLATSVSGGIFSIKNNISEDKIRAGLKNGELVPVGLTGQEEGIGFHTMLFDSENEKNKAFLDKWRKTHPVQSKYQSKMGCSGEYIPAVYLQELGFCDVKQLRAYIQSGKIKGVIREIKTPNGLKRQPLWI